MTGTPEGSTESGFMEKPGNEPATPGLQGMRKNIGNMYNVHLWIHVLDVLTIFRSFI